jgi:VanZ family protein
MTFRKNLIKYWLPTVLALSIVFWMSSGTFSARNTAPLIKPIVSFLAPEIPSQQVGLIHSLIRKAGHFTEYFILGLLLFRAFRGRFSRSFSWRCSFLAVVVVVLWAASEEFHQYFIPTRSSSAVDVGIDAAGGVLAQFVSALRCSFREKGR